MRTHTAFSGVVLTCSTIILGISALPIAIEQQDSVGPDAWPWSCYKFGELAQQAIPGEFDALIPVLKSTFENPDVKPIDTVDARRRLLKIRNYLDVFAPAYPADDADAVEEHISKTEKLEANATAIVEVVTEDITIEIDKKKSKDLFVEIRSALDKGYEIIGTFKDLGEDDIKDKKLEEELRHECVKWYSEFTKQNEKDDFSSFLKQPDLDKFHKHSKWSKFFWKADTSMFPKEGMSGVAVLEQLVKIQFEQILEREKSVLKLKTILDYDAHEEYHNFRKSIRAIFREDEMFGNLVFDAASKDDLAVLAHVYHVFGKLNDKWNKWWYYHKKGKKEEEKMAKEVSKDWEKLKKDVKKWDIPGVVKRIEAAMIEPCKL